MKYPVIPPRRQFGQTGFTLIELMGIIAVLGIFAAVVVSYYQDYLVKSRFSNVKVSVEPIKAAMASCIRQHAGSLTSCDTAEKLDIMMPAPTGDLANVRIASQTAAITATATAPAGGYTYVLTPSVTTTGDKEIVFKVSGTCVAAGDIC